MKKVLIVEDDEYTQARYAREFGDKVFILAATTIAQARTLFAANPDIDGIIMDGCMDNKDRVNTQPLVAEIRKTFTGPMIGASLLLDYQAILVRSGCDVGSNKDKAAAKLLEMLGL